jgi:hypothetical protein
MKISRRGSARNEGWNMIDLSKSLVEWDAETKCVTLTKRRVTDFTSRSKHHYKISIPLDELGKMLQEVAKGFSAPSE